MQRLQWSFWSLKCHRCFLLPPLSSCATMWATSIFAYLYMCRCRRSSCHFASSTHIISVDGHFPAALAVFYITQQFFCFFLNNIFLYLLWSTALTFFAAAKSCLFAISSNAECSTFIFSLRTTTPTFWQLICRFSTVYSIYYMTYLLTYSNATKQQINGGRSRGICKVHWWHFLKIKISPQVCLDVGVGVASLGLLHLRCCCCSRDKKVSFGFAIDWRQVTTFTHTPKWEVLQIQWIASK